MEEVSYRNAPAQKKVIHFSLFSLMFGLIELALDFADTWSFKLFYKAVRTRQSQRKNKQHQKITKQQAHVTMETKFSIRFPLIITTLFAEITFELPTYKFSEIHTNMCSDRSIEVKLPALMVNYERPTNRSTDRHRPTDGQTGSFQSSRQK